MFKTKYIYIISGQSSLVACYLCTPTSTVFTCIHNSAQSMGYLVLSHRIALGRRAEFLDSAGFSGILGFRSITSLAWSAHYGTGGIGSH